MNLSLSKETLYDWNGANVAIFKQINSISGKYYDIAMQNITMLGDKKLLPYFLSIIAAYALVNFIGHVVSRRSDTKHYLMMWVGVFMVMAASLGASYVATSNLKEHFSYPRPYAALQEKEVRVLVEKVADDENHSLPSGHTALATVIILSLWPALGLGFRWFGAAAIFAVAWSRIAVGAHFPADVLAGFILCGAIVLIVRKVIYGTFANLFGVYFHPDHD